MSNYFWKLGEQYIIRTVTMIYVGDVKEVSEKDIILTNAAWIPETSRWNEFVKGEAPIEMEPYAEDVLVKQDPILDATRVKDRMKIEVK